MKCIHCGNDTTYPTRSKNGRRCGTCLHPFAFEPKTDPRTVSDPMFQRCVKDVSAEGTLQFTARQLYYELNRRLVKKQVHIPRPFGWGMAAWGAGGVIGAIALSPVLIPVGVVGAIVTGAVGANVGKKKPQARIVRLPFREFESAYLTPWLNAHGPIPGLLPPVMSSAPRRTQVYPAPDPPDLSAYSFDRALVTDRADVAAMLVANRFHFENNCAILSLDGRFPANGRFDQVKEMLRRNPRLIVFALHDASAEGMAMGTRLRGPDWFAPDTGARIVDLGLRPSHAMKANMLLQKDGAVSVPADLRATVPPDEVKWLEEGFVAEAEAMRPAKLMRAVYQAFARSTQVGPDGEIILIDSGPGIWVYNGSADVYAADSFG